MISREASAKLATVMSHEGSHVLGNRVEGYAYISNYGMSVGHSPWWEATPKLKRFHPDLYNTYDFINIGWINND